MKEIVNWNPVYNYFKWVSVSQHNTEYKAAVDSRVIYIRNQLNGFYCTCFIKYLHQEIFAALEGKIETPDLRRPKNQLKWFKISNIVAPFPDVLGTVHSLISPGGSASSCCSSCSSSCCSSCCPSCLQNTDPVFPSSSQTNVGTLIGAAVQGPAVRSAALCSLSSSAASRRNNSSLRPRQHSQPITCSRQLISSSSPASPSLLLWISAPPPPTSCSVCLLLIVLYLFIHLCDTHMFLGFQACKHVFVSSSRLRTPGRICYLQIRTASHLQSVNFNSLNQRECLSFSRGILPPAEEGEPEIIGSSDVFVLCLCAASSSNRQRALGSQVSLWNTLKTF